MAKNNKCMLVDTSVDILAESKITSENSVLGTPLISFCFPLDFSCLAHIFMREIFQFLQLQLFVAACFSALVLPIFSATFV